VISITGTPPLKNGEVMRGLVGAFYCRMLDVEECIAKDIEGYARKAIEIASDPRCAIQFVQIYCRIAISCMTICSQPTLDRLSCSLTDQFYKQP
jgi:hypothetical protein